LGQAADAHRAGEEAAVAGVQGDLPAAEHARVHGVERVAASVVASRGALPGGWRCDLLERGGRTAAPGEHQAQRARRQRSSGERTRPRETALPCVRGPHAADRSTRANAAATLACGAGCGRATSPCLSTLIRSASTRVRGRARRRVTFARRPADLTGGTPMKLRHGALLVVLALAASLL